MGHLMKRAFFICAAVGDKKMEVRVEIDSPAEGLNDSDDSRRQFCAGEDFKIIQKRSDPAATQVVLKWPLVFEEDTKHLWDDKNHLAVRHIEQKLFSYPLSPFEKFLLRKTGEGLRY